jgi:hypothetical protein
MASESSIDKTRISDSLAEQAARVVIHKHALLPNCVEDCLVGSLRPPTSGASIGSTRT